jgi:hypothetical protein
VPLKQEIEEIRESVKAHDRQIDGLIRAFQAEHETIRALSSTLATLAENAAVHDRQIRDLIKEWQAYLRRLPPQ